MGAFPSLIIPPLNIKSGGLPIDAPRSFFYDAPMVKAVTVEEPANIGARSKVENNNQVGVWFDLNSVASPSTINYAGKLIPQQKSRKE
jgi:hypothetical protein